MSDTLHGDLLEQSYVHVGLEEKLPRKTKHLFCIQYTSPKVYGHCTNETKVTFMFCHISELENGLNLIRRIWDVFDRPETFLTQSISSPLVDIDDF
jgi:hypothetical protein